MTLLSHKQLLKLVTDEVISPVQYTSINAASIDIHLGNKILVESRQLGEYGLRPAIDYAKRERPSMAEIQIDPVNGYILAPGEFILAQSVEVFNLPNNISAEYKLKSSMARIGLEHMNAGWCDAGWHGSVLTLEFKNMLQHHAIRIRPGDAIGQMIFFKHDRVSDDASYATRGRYNRDATVSGIKE